MIKVKFKKLHHNAVLPSYAKPGDAGLDLTVTEIQYKDEFTEYRFGISVEIPDGFFGLLVPRSSITKMNLMLKNSVGIIDAGFRGEIVARFKTVKFDVGFYEGAKYQKGDRAAQLIILPYPNIQPEFAEELTVTERGEGGFGSTN